jgi:hypothetical protein
VVVAGRLVLFRTCIVEQGSVSVDAKRDHRRRRHCSPGCNPTALEPEKRGGSGGLPVARRLAAAVVQYPRAGSDLPVWSGAGAEKLSGQTARAAEQFGRQRPVRLHCARGRWRRIGGTAGISLGDVVRGSEPHPGSRARDAVSLGDGSEPVTVALVAAHAVEEAAVVRPDHAGGYVGTNAGDRRRGRLGTPRRAAVAMAALSCCDRARGSGAAAPQPQRDRRGGLGGWRRLRLEPAGDQPVPGPVDPLRSRWIVDGRHLRFVGVPAARWRPRDLCDGLGYSRPAPVSPPRAPAAEGSLRGFAKGAAQRGRATTVARATVQSRRNLHRARGRRRAISRRSCPIARAGGGGRL